MGRLGSKNGALDAPSTAGSDWNAIAADSRS